MHVSSVCVLLGAFVRAAISTWSRASICLVILHETVGSTRLGSALAAHTYFVNAHFLSSKAGIDPTAWFTAIPVHSLANCWHRSIAGGETLWRNTRWASRGRRGGWTLSRRSWGDKTPLTTGE